MTEAQRKADNKRRRDARKAASKGESEATGSLHKEDKLIFLTADDLLQLLVNNRLSAAAGKRDDVPPVDPGYENSRITQAASALGDQASSQSAPVSVLIDDVHSRTSGLRNRLEALRDSLVYGAHPDAPREKGMAVEAGKPSQGPSKDALNFAFSNLAVSEALVEEIARYLLNL